MFSHRRHKVKIILGQGEIIGILNDQLLNTRRLQNVSSLENLSLKQKVTELTTRLETVTKCQAEEEISKLFSPPNELKSKEKTLKRRPPYPCNSAESFPCSKRSLSDSDEEDNVTAIPAFKRIKLTREKMIAEEDYEKEIEDLKNEVESQTGIISSLRLSKDRKEEKIQGLRLELAREYSLNEKYFKLNSLQQTIAKISKISDKFNRKTKKKNAILAELQAKNEESNRLKAELAKKDREIKQLQSSASLSQQELFEANSKIQNLEVTVSSLVSQKDEIHRQLETKLEGQQVKHESLQKDVEKKTKMLNNLARKFVKLKRDEKYNADSLVASVKIIDNLETELKAKNIFLEKYKAL